MAISILAPMAKGGEFFLYQAVMHGLDLPEFTLSKIGVSVEEGRDKITLYGYKKTIELKKGEIDIDKIYKNCRSVPPNPDEPMPGDAKIFILEEEKDRVIQSFLLIVEEDVKRFQLFELLKLGDFYIEKEKGTPGYDEEVYEFIDKVVDLRFKHRKASKPRD